MITISNELQVNAALQKHMEGLRKNILSKIIKIDGIPAKNAIVDFLKLNLNSILTENPEQLLVLNQEFENIISHLLEKSKISCRKKLKKVINYENFLKEKKSYWAYDLAKNLDIVVCPYCNANFTLSVFDSNGRKISRPTFDHFYPKHAYPLLSLSFYNLIPSCYVCNSSIKGTVSISINTHFHPYIHNIEKELLFKYKPTTVTGAIGFDESFDIEIKSIDNSIEETRIKNHVESFKLNYIYKHHRSYASEIIFKSYMSGGSYLKSLQASFPNLKLDESEFYRLAYGNYFYSHELGKRILSKMTKDLVSQLDDYLINP